MSFVGTPFLTKRHDTKPLSDTLEREQTPGDGDFAPINLTGTTVRFLVSDPDTGLSVFSGAATLTGTPTDGVVTYTPTAPQMALGGYTDDVFPLTLRAEWEVTYAGGIIETIPAGRDYRKLVVGADLG